MNDAPMRILLALLAAQAVCAFALAAVAVMVLVGVLP